MKRKREGNHSRSRRLKTDTDRNHFFDNLDNRCDPQRVQEKAQLQCKVLDPTWDPTRPTAHSLLASAVAHALDHTPLALEVYLVIADYVTDARLVDWHARLLLPDKSEYHLASIYPKGQLKRATFVRAYIQPLDEADRDRHESFHLVDMLTLPTSSPVPKEFGAYYGDHLQIVVLKQGDISRLKADESNWYTQLLFAYNPPPSSVCFALSRDGATDQVAVPKSMQFPRWKRPLLSIYKLYNVLGYRINQVGKIDPVSLPPNNKPSNSWSRQCLDSCSIS